MEHGPPLSKMMQIFQQFQNNACQYTISRHLGISPSTVHNITKYHKQISACKAQGPKAISISCSINDATPLLL